MSLTVFPTKIPRSPPEGSMDYVIHSPCMISHHFLAIKASVLWITSSLQADIDLVRTNLEDCASLLGNGLANIPLRVHSH